MFRLQVALALACATPAAFGLTPQSSEASAAAAVPTLGSVITIGSGDPSRLVCVPPEAVSGYADGCATTTEFVAGQTVTFEINVYGLAPSEIAHVGVYQGNFLQCGPLVATLGNVPVGSVDVCGVASSTFAGGSSETPTATYFATVAVPVFPLTFDGLADGEVFFLVTPVDPSEAPIRGQLTVPLGSIPERDALPIPSGLDAYITLDPGSGELDYEVGILEPNFSTAEGAGAVAKIFNGEPSQGAQEIATLQPVSPTRWQGTIQGLTSGQVVEYASELWWIRVISSNGAIEDRRLVRGSMNGWPQTISSTLGGTQGLWIEAGEPFAGGLYLILGTMSGTSPATLLPDAQGGFLGGVLGLPLVLDSYTNLTLTAGLGSPGSGVIGTPFGILNSQGNAKTILRVPSNVLSLNGRVTFHHSAVFLDPQTLDVWDVSNAVPCVVQP